MATDMAVSAVNGESVRTFAGHLSAEDRIWLTCVKPP